MPNKCQLLNIGNQAIGIRSRQDKGHIARDSKRRRVLNFSGKGKESLRVQSPAQQNGSDRHQKQQHSKPASPHGIPPVDLPIEPIVQDIAVLETASSSKV
jgi:hypothetical protein